MKLQWFAYMGIAFSLLEMGATLEYWRSIYFIGHIVIAGLYIAASIASPAKSKSAQVKDTN